MNKEINRNKKVGAHHIYTSLRFKSAEAEKRLMPQCFAADSSAAKHKHQFFAVMRRTGYLFFILSLFPLLLLQSSCINDMPKSGDDTAHLSLTLDVGKTTRALSDAESTVNDITVLVFDSSNNLIGSNYSTFTATAAFYAMNVTAHTGTNCTIYAIANTGSSIYFSGVSTLDQFKSKYATLKSVSDLANQNSVIMFAKKTGVTLTPSTSLSGFSLSRLCSKISITITPASGITITGYQLCHVPTNSNIYDESPTSNPSGSYTDFPVVSGLSSTNPVTPVYYMYENLAGTSSTSTSEALRTSMNAPADASYLLIYAKTSKWSSIYRVYLGQTSSTDYTNYSILRNHDYACSIVINGQGQTDTRVAAPVGSYLYSDGTWGISTPSSTATPHIIGIVFSSETSVKDKAKNWVHGYAMALKNATASCYWYDGTNKYIKVFTDTYPTWVSLTSDKDGYDKTMKVSNTYKPLSTSKYSAFYYALNYGTSNVSGTSQYAAPANTSGWYLPSVGQWYDILVNFCGLSATPSLSSSGNGGSWRSLYGQSSSQAAAYSINNYLNVVGNSGYSVDVFNSSSRTVYWSASEPTSNNGSAYATYFIITDNATGTDGVNLGQDNKNDLCIVRSVIAF